MPMKNILLLLVLCCSMMAHASVFCYLEFTNQSGVTTSLTVTNLTMKVAGSELEVTNDEGTVAFVLTELATMQFAADKTTTDIDNVLNGDAPVEVYTMTGVQVGTYGSLLEASKSLNAGGYILSNGTQSQTIVIKK